MNQFNNVPGNDGEKSGNTKWDSMSFDQLESDPVAEPVLQQVALEYLKRNHPEAFFSEYTGEIDSWGYLETTHKDIGKTKPSQQIGGGDPMMQVLKMTRVRLKENRVDAGKRIQEQDIEHEEKLQEVIVDILEIGHLGTKTDAELQTMLKTKNPKDYNEMDRELPPSKLEEEMVDFAIETLQRLKRIIKNSKV